MQRSLCTDKTWPASPKEIWKHSDAAGPSVAVKRSKPATMPGESITLPYCTNPGVASFLSLQPNPVSMDRNAGIQKHCKAASA